MKMENCNQEILTSTMISYGQSKYIGIYALASIANEWGRRDKGGSVCDNTTFGLQIQIKWNAKNIAKNL
jgi:hypothetical protein